MAQEESAEKQELDRLRDGIDRIDGADGIVRACRVCKDRIGG